MRRIGLSLVLLGLIGCGPRVIHDKPVELDPGEVKGPVLLDLKKDARLSVEVTSLGVPVDVYVVLEKDQQAASDAIAAEKTPAGVLAKELKTEGKTLEVTMPEQSGLAILVSNPLQNRKKTTATVKVSRL